jgi:uncharacterized membrane protein YheB (UPF0754 family)
MISYVLAPFLTAAIGWFTNWVAVKMLFKPMSPKVFWGMRFQGLIPRRQKELASQCAEIVERELLQQHMIRSAVEGADIGAVVETKVRYLMRTKLLSKLNSIPMLGAMLGEANFKQLEDYVVAEMKVMSTDLAIEFAGEIEDKLQVRAIVEERIQSFELERLEGIVSSVAAKEFKTIEWVGAFLGFFVGLFQSLLFYMSS